MILQISAPLSAEYSIPMVKVAARRLVETVIAVPGTAIKVVLLGVAAARFLAKAILVPTLSVHPVSSVPARKDTTTVKVLTVVTGTRTALATKAAIDLTGTPPRVTGKTTAASQLKESARKDTTTVKVLIVVTGTGTALATKAAIDLTGTPTRVTGKTAAASLLERSDADWWETSDECHIVFEVRPRQQF